METSCQSIISWLFSLVATESTKLGVHPQCAQQTYVYGGFPRDLLIEKPPTDFDIRVPSKEVADAVVQAL
jgi:hypothetical protein